MKLLLNIFVLLISVGAAAQNPLAEISRLTTDDYVLLSWSYTTGRYLTMADIGTMYFINHRFRNNINVSGVYARDVQENRTLRVTPSLQEGRDGKKFIGWQEFNALLLQRDTLNTRATPRRN